MDDELQELKRVIASGGDEPSELEELAGAVDAYRANPNQEDHDSLIERLGDAVDRLEATHPEISTALARVVDALTAFGL